mgnify:FL=1
MAKCKKLEALTGLRYGMRGEELDRLRNLAGPSVNLADADSKYYY